MTVLPILQDGGGAAGVNEGAEEDFGYDRGTCRGHFRAT